MPFVTNLVAGVALVKLAGEEFNAAPTYFKALENIGGAKFGGPLDFFSGIATKINPPVNYLPNPQDGPVWVKGAFGTLPHYAISVDGVSKVYVARSHCENNLLPGKYLPHHSACYVSLRGDEYFRKSFEVLCGGRTKWQRFDARKDKIPANAIQGGYTIAGETLFIGRVVHKGSYSSGKIHPSHFCCYIPYGNKEYKYPVCDILMMAV